MTHNDENTMRLIREALAEDSVAQDATVDFLNIADEPIDAIVLAGDGGVLAGCELFARVFELVDNTVTVDMTGEDGMVVDPGAVVCEISGAARSILLAERVALNIIGKLSGIASLTARYVDAVRTAGITILDTRKTTPLWRDLEKYAVRCGGAENHRRDLSAMILVKENHRRAVGGHEALIELLRAQGHKQGRFVEVEVDSMTFLESLADVPLDRIMLDNFTPDDVIDGLRVIDRFVKRPQIEVSGGISLETIGAYAIEGVDYISVGALTHSAPAFSFSLQVIES